MNQSILFNEAADWLPAESGWQLTAMTGQGLVYAIVSLTWLQRQSGDNLTDECLREQTWAAWRWLAEEEIEQALTTPSVDSTGTIRL